jgi:hypothetical protein
MSSRQSAPRRVRRGSSRTAGGGGASGSGSMAIQVAKLFNAERKIGCDLDVITMQGWKRSDRFDRSPLDLTVVVIPRIAHASG